ncbi:MAG: hypothetical protein CMF56_06855 [Leifsonia sp.]|mgnify:CR=1 FL=1|nr:hypothetical protein [Leifsonia sp.]
MARRPVTRTPPLAAVLAVQTVLRDAGLEPVVGGSALLASLSADLDEVHDWDVLVDADPDTVARSLAALGRPVRRAPEPAPEPYASDALFVVDAGDHEIDVIVRFRIRIRTGTGVLEVPARPGGTWRGLTMARPEDWARAYRAMGRERSAALLESAASDAATKG